MSLANDKKFIEDTKDLTDWEYEQAKREERKKSKAKRGGRNSAKRKWSELGED